MGFHKNRTDVRTRWNSQGMTLVFLIKPKVKFKNVRVLCGQPVESNREHGTGDKDSAGPSSRRLTWVDMDRLVPRCGVE